MTPLQQARRTQMEILMADPIEINTRPCDALQAHVHPTNHEGDVCGWLDWVDPTPRPKTGDPDLEPDYSPNDLDYFADQAADAYERNHGVDR